MTTSICLKKKVISTYVKIGVVPRFSDFDVSSIIFRRPPGPGQCRRMKMKEPRLKIDHCDSLAIEWRWTGPGGNKWMKRCPILLGSNFLTQTFWYIIIFHKILSYLFFIFFNSLKIYFAIFADFCRFFRIFPDFRSLPLWKSMNCRFWNSKWTCLR